MDRETVILFTRNGLGHAPAELQQGLVAKFLSLTLESGELPGKILFYTEGVKLVCEGSAVIPQLEEMEKRGVELVICQTCLVFFGLADKVHVGVVGGMGDILTTLQKAARVLSV
ncbi:MAG: DsrE family protein [Anaerolineaceae bacterium]|nr:DsrE family protein [Anaerolineaceae bacterium]